MPFTSDFKIWSKAKWPLARMTPRPLRGKRGNTLAFLHAGAANIKHYGIKKTAQQLDVRVLTLGEEGFIFIILTKFSSIEHKQLILEDSYYRSEHITDIWMKLVRLSEFSSKYSSGGGLVNSEVNSCTVIGLHSLHVTLRPVLWDRAVASRSVGRLLEWSAGKSRQFSN